MLLWIFYSILFRTFSVEESFKVYGFTAFWHLTDTITILVFLDARDRPRIPESFPWFGTRNVLGHYGRRQSGNTLYGIKWRTERADSQPRTRVISRARGRNTRGWPGWCRYVGEGGDEALPAWAQGSATDFCGQVGPALGSWRAVSRSARSVASVVHHRPPY